ncbi:hypothetical protein O6H91_15G041600 [Diphasiastrum complanatum]|uniref:Uncharacterized protein n=1 Tax=Diphasiastrum complanatum TaxID=34168 RepID=A0ACC2BHL1_DIPCM|nr:hypothetical protein O6H91_15G041600 [Diphasiastrum complanatum]
MAHFGMLGKEEGEEVHQKLAALNYPRVTVPVKSLLYAGLDPNAFFE